VMDDTLSNHALHTHHMHTCQSQINSLMSSFPVPLNSQGAYYLAL